MSSGKYLHIFYLFIITLFVSSCNLDIYKGFDEPILTENIFEINDSLIKKDPVKLLIQPSSPINKVFGYPLGLSIYKIASINPDEKFESWLYKKPKRYERLSKVLSEKQISQLKRYNNSFNEFLRSFLKNFCNIHQIKFNSSFICNSR